MKDAQGLDFTVLDRVAVAISYGSRARLKVGTVEIVDPNKKTLKLRWDDNHKLSGLMRYGEANRWVKL